MYLSELTIKNYYFLFVVYLLSDKDLVLSNLCSLGFLG